MVTVREKISGKEFRRNFVKPRKPVLITGETENWNAVRAWDGKYFEEVAGDFQFAVKTGDVSAGQRLKMSLAEYTQLLEDYEQALEKDPSTPRPPYLHDVPIFLLLPQLRKDVEPFTAELFPRWYRKNWSSFVQFFMGSKNSLTPLHFDTLFTHNLFFQIKGEKVFYLVSPEDRAKCYMKSWRWASVDLENPDYEKYPLLKDVEVSKVTVRAGDMLYLPAGTLHQVRGLSSSISFNIDWHTRRSVTTGLFSGFKGAPSANVYYNFMVALGLYLGVPSRMIFPFYKSYLNYVS